MIQWSVKILFKCRYKDSTLAHQALKSAIEKHNAKGGSVVVMDVTTGEILAISNQLLEIFHYQKIVFQESIRIKQSLISLSLAQHSRP